MFDMATGVTEIGELFARLRGPDAPAESLEEWVELVAQSQATMNAIGAVQAYAVARVAAFETQEYEDGTIEELPRRLGCSRLDAPSLVAGPLGVSEQAASTRVSDAVRMATCLGPVLEAMADGRLDGWRASVIAAELCDAPDEVAHRVAETLAPRLGRETAGPLRRRVVRELSAIDPALVRQRAARARAERSLRRITDYLGVDRWEANLPIERSREAWAAVDVVARDYVDEGRNPTLEQARADAMIDLILGRTRGSYEVQLAVPQDLVDDLLAALSDAAEAESEAEAPSQADPQPSDTESRSDAETPSDTRAAAEASAEPPPQGDPQSSDTESRSDVEAHPEQAVTDQHDSVNDAVEAHGATVGATAPAAAGPVQPSVSVKVGTTAADSTADQGRSPTDTEVVHPTTAATAGTAGADSTTDQESSSADAETAHPTAFAKVGATAGASDPGHGATPAGAGTDQTRTSASARSESELPADAMVPVIGYGTPGTSFVPLGWLRDLLARVRCRVSLVGCDPVTGARLSPPREVERPAGRGVRGTGDRRGEPADSPGGERTDRRGRRRRRRRPPVLETDAYRPTEALAALVRARDGRCRFPDCAVSARFCDLDHVQPWPAGPTAAGNLVCLCRRHHRIKQRPGWHARLLPDGTLEVTDPTGRVRTSLPVDLLGRADGRALPPSRAEPRSGWEPEETAYPPAGSGGDQEEPFSWLEDMWAETIVRVEQYLAAEAARAEAEERARAWAEPPPF